MQTQKSTFTAKFSPISSLEVIFFCSYSLLGSSYSLSFWCILTLLQFSTSQLHCMLGNSQNFRQRLFLPHIFHIYTKSTATPTYHQNFVLVVFSVVANSKICRGRSRNSFVVESQGYFILESWPFLQFHEQGAKFANEVHHLTRFFEKVDSQLPSRLMMLIRQPTKDEKWL